MVTVELDDDQLGWLIRATKNSISHIEKYGSHIPERKIRLESFRVLLKQLEQKATGFNPDDVAGYHPGQSDAERKKRGS